MGAGDAVPDRLLAARIRGQSGLVTRTQALEAGLTAEGIRWKVRSERWSLVHPGVYLTELGRDDWEMKAVAALLYVGRPAALYGPSAAYACGLVRASSSEMHIMVPFDRGSSKRPGIITHRIRNFEKQLDPTAWPHRTTMEHTVLNLCGDRDLDGVVSLMARACQQNLTTASRLAEVVRSMPKLRQRSSLLEVLGDIGAGAQSAAEVRYIRDVERAHGLPVGTRQAPGPNGTFRDNLYDEFGVIVEIDGRRGHEGWLGQQRDGRRDRGSAIEGKITVRLYWIDTVHPCETAVELAQIFRRRGWAGQIHACRKSGCAAA